MIRPLLTFLFWTAVLSGAPGAASAEELRLLVAVGQNTGLPGEVRLRYAETDAEAYVDLLQDRGRVNRSDSVLLRGRTGDELRDTLRAMRARAQAHSGDVLLMFYYSGHADSLDLHMGNERFPLKELDALLNSVRAKLRVSVVDACRTQGDTKAKGFQKVAAFAVKLAAPVGIKGVVTIRSSAEGEQSQESSNLRGAVFTHYLLNGLRGAADRDEDQRVSLNEAYTYAYRQTVRRSAASTGNVMHPSVELDIEGAGSLILTHTSAIQSSITLPKEGDTRYLVYDRHSGAVRAEVWSDPTRHIDVPVPAGTYLIQRRKGSKSGAHEARLLPKESLKLGASLFRAIPETVLAAKGGQLRLVHQEVRLGYSPILWGDGRFAQRLRGRYGIGAVTWTTSLGVDVGETKYVTPSDTRTERWLGADVRLEGRRLFGPIDAHIAGIVRYVTQELTLPDAGLAAAAGYRTESLFDGVTGGPSAGVGWRYDLTWHWSLSAEVGGSLLFAREGGDTTLRPETHFETAIVAEF